jgi:hypothetical protein
MKLVRLDLELKLLMIAIGTCIWGAALLIHPEFMQISVSAITVVVIGELFALWCSDNGPHVVAKFSVLSICFGTQSIAFLSEGMHFLPSTFFAAVAVYCAWMAFEKFRKLSRQRMTSTLQAAYGGIAPFKLPMMPIRDMVVIPGMMTRAVAGRESSVRALEYAEANNSCIFLATQHDDTVDTPSAKEISEFGCICKVVQTVKMDNGHLRVLFEGLEMAKTLATDDSKGFFFVTVRGLDSEGRVAQV